MKVAPAELQMVAAAVTSEQLTMVALMGTAGLPTTLFSAPLCRPSICKAYIRFIATLGVCCTATEAECGTWIVLLLPASAATADGPSAAVCAEPAADRPIRRC